MRSVNSSKNITHTQLYSWRVSTYQLETVV